MKICDSWLQEHVAHGLSPRDLAERLTMLGLEVESVEFAGAPVAGLVVGHVLNVQRHPQADKLSVCRVDVGQREPLTIVCGAANVRAGGRYPTALEGARLQNGAVIRATRIRGESSAGMLCSARELGLDDGVDGLLELDDEPPVGTDASRLLRLGDPILDVNVTPNRADCLSVAGIAREVAAACRAGLSVPGAAAVAALSNDSFPVSVGDVADCPRFAGRVIRGIRASARTPLWMRERLRRCGVRPIHPVVDVTNFVMLELGQPMHAYDLHKLTGGINVRRARDGERLTLLDGAEATLDRAILVIADEQGAVGLAGIMGGALTAVSGGTRDIFLESAFFSPAAIAGRARRFGLHTDASMRFERGVDPTAQLPALERATALIIQIAGGEPGPVGEQLAPSRLPSRSAVRLRRSRLAHVLGVALPDRDVTGIMTRLGLAARPDDSGWEVVPPAPRFDIEREEDLIEEVGRVYGYERIAAVTERAPVRAAAVGEVAEARSGLASALEARGYQEVVTYSFIDAQLDRQFGGSDAPWLVLRNPIASDLAVMRQSLWPGLVQVVRQNQRRQMRRVRIFEIGTRFRPSPGGGHVEEECLAGVAVGDSLPEQWGVAARAVDLFDLKGDLQSLFALRGWRGKMELTPGMHPALHPGRSGRIHLDGEDIGWLGQLHPSLAERLDVQGAVLFEFVTARVREHLRPSYERQSVFPSVRRDLAVVVERDVAGAALLAAIREAAPATLREAFIFDIYTGPQVGDTQKSIAIGLILQETSRTLTDEDANAVLETARTALSRRFQAKIRQ